MLIPISKITSADEAELEHLREDLRDRRWARHRQQLRYLVASLAVLLPGTAVATINHYLF